jgi:hypothetical protein
MREFFMFLFSRVIGCMPSMNSFSNISCEMYPRSANIFPNSFLRNILSFGDSRSSAWSAFQMVAIPGVPAMLSSKKILNKRQAAVFRQRSPAKVQRSKPSGWRFRKSSGNGTNLLRKTGNLLRKKKNLPERFSVFHAIGVFDRACTLRKLRQFEMHPLHVAPV